MPIDEQPELWRSRAHMHICKEWCGACGVVSRRSIDRGHGWRRRGLRRGLRGLRGHRSDEVKVLEQLVLGVYAASDRV